MNIETRVNQKNNETKQPFVICNDEKIFRRAENELKIKCYTKLEKAIKKNNGGASCSQVTFRLSL